MKTDKRCEMSEIYYNNTNHYNIIIITTRGRRRLRIVKRSS